MPIPCSLNPLGVEKDWFEMLIKVPTANYAWSLGTNNTFGSVYDIRIEWGDGVVSTRHNDGTYNHTYTSKGTYLIRVRASFINRWNFVPSGKSYQVLDCNWNWRALGDVRQIYTSYLLNPGLSPITSLPHTLTSLSVFCGYPSKQRAWITEIPDGVTDFASCCNSNIFAGFYITKLPPNMTNLYRFPRLSGGYGGHMSYIDIGAVCANAPANGFERLQNITGFMNDCRVGNGTIVQFLHKCPNAVTLKQSSNTEKPFSGTDATLFGDYDHFECTVKITEENQVWGFTPTSEHGLWYVWQWGDGSDVPNASNVTHIDVFESGVRIEHTYAAPGTYTVKLAMHADSIAFDAYESDNGQWWALGNPEH